MSKNEKEQAPQTHTPTDHPPEGETQTNEGNTLRPKEVCICQGKPEKNIYFNLILINKQNRHKT